MSSRKRAWYATLIGVGGLAALAFAYWFSYEPAPSIRVRWRDHVSQELQEALERKYMLSNRRGPHPDAPRSLAYDLLDTRPSNIEALVKDPAVYDTNDIDDEDIFQVRPGTAYGDRWLWVADRTPLLRITWVRWTLICGLAALAIAGLRGLLAPRGQ